tara:strand:- start:8328 stop:10913 length:2586 start_codon:yes stop_codon:yes gene_type:complete
MQIRTISKQHPRLRIIFLLFILFGSTSCSIFEAPTTDIAQQPSEYLLSEMYRQGIDTSEQLRDMLKTTKIHNALPQQTQAAIKEYPVITKDLLLAMSKQKNHQLAAIHYIEKHTAQPNNYIYVALSLFPIDGYRLAEKLSLSDKITEEHITTASLRAGFDPALIFTATASNDEGYRIVPLMQSASITLYNQTEDSTAEIKFKATDDNEWHSGLALQWEPIQGALSGSIVYLESDTEYHVKVTQSQSGVEQSENEYSFRTRSESPPIDPSKIYYLSDIYQSGQLDLEALGIEGSENGWAKIIGDGVTVEADENENSAIYIGSQNYVMLENVTTIGGLRYGIHGYKAHHIWIKGCDISRYGRTYTEYRNGKAYVSVESTTPINYESGIYLERSGVVVIEGCEIHSPNGKANSWEYGHPKGPNALQVWGDHRTEAFKGQYIVRNNRFYGTPEHRFNDVIEGRGNRKRDGGFVRDSAVYNNYLAYANDDLIEIDGGQANVLVYNNEMTQGYCGISTAPNMIGPSYVFHNFIHDLGDERGKEWTAIKMGGLMDSPAGITNIFENLIVTNRNGISASSVNGDRTLWVNARNNVFISRTYSNMVGFGIYDVEKYTGSTFSNNLIYNTSAQRPVYDAAAEDDFLYPDSDNLVLINALTNTEEGRVTHIPIAENAKIANFSQVQTARLSDTTDFNVEEKIIPITFNADSFSSFSNQDKYGTLTVSEDSMDVTITGNNWKKYPFIYTLTPESTLKFSIIYEGKSEILGIGFETDNEITSNRTFQLSGTQNWGLHELLIQENSTSEVTIPVGKYIVGDIKYIVFILDNDAKKDLKVTFKDIILSEKDHETPATDENQTDVQIRIGSTKNNVN